MNTNRTQSTDVNIVGVEGHDDVAISMTESQSRTLTDALITITRKTLSRNRHMIDSNKDIRSITLTIKLTDKQKPYKVFLMPTHESYPG